MRCVQCAYQFAAERPKVGDHFATMLEKAVARSQAPLKQIELKPYDGPVLEPRPRGIHGRSGEGQR